MSNILKVPSILNYKIHGILIRSTLLYCFLSCHLHSQESAFPHPNHTQDNLILYFADWSANIAFSGKKFWSTALRFEYSISLRNFFWQKYLGSVWIHGAAVGSMSLRLGMPSGVVKYPRCWIGHGVCLRKWCWCDFWRKVKGNCAILPA